MGSSTESDNWDRNLDAIQQGVNSTINKTTKSTPAEPMFGLNKQQTDSDGLCSANEIVDITKIRATASRRIEENRIRQDHYFNKTRRTDISFKVGDLALTKISSFPSNDRNSKKLLLKFKDQFQISEALPHDRFRVKENIHATRSRIPHEAIVGLENVKTYVSGWQR